MKSTKELTCSYCKNKFLETELVVVTKTRKACKNCLETKVRENADYKELIAYICRGFRQTAPTGKQLKDIKTFKEMGISYKEIQWTLYYIYGILNKKIEDKSLGLVPYYHKEAMEHFRTVERVKESVKNAEPQEEITIVRTPCNRKPRIDKTRYVNIAEIG